MRSSVFTIPPAAWLLLAGSVTVFIECRHNCAPAHKPEPPQTGTRQNYRHQLSLEDETLSQVSNWRSGSANWRLDLWQKRLESSWCRCFYIWLASSPPMYASPSIYNRGRGCALPVTWEKCISASAWHDKTFHLQLPSFDNMHSKEGEVAMSESFFEKGGGWAG